MVIDELPILYPSLVIFNVKSLVNLYAQVNYLGSAYFTRALLPTLKRLYPKGVSKERGHLHGHLVFVSSMGGQLGVYGYSAYGASKFALRGFAEAIQMELAAHNVWVTLAHPADTATPGFDRENTCKAFTFY